MAHSISLRLSKGRKSYFVNFLKNIVSLAQRESVKYQYQIEGKGELFQAKYSTTKSTNSFLENVYLKYDNYKIKLYMLDTDVYFLGFQVLGRNFKGKIYEMGHADNTYIEGSTSLQIGESYGDLGCGDESTLGTVSVCETTLIQSFETLRRYSLHDNNNINQTQPSKDEMKRALVRIVLMIEAMRFKEIRDVFASGYTMGGESSQLEGYATYVHKWRTSSCALRAAILSGVPYKAPPVVYVIKSPKEGDEDDN